MKILQHYLNVWKKTFDYSSRSTRAEYWIFSLINFIIIIVLCLLPMIFNTNTSEQDLSIVAQAFLIFFIAYVIAVIFPSISVTVRRLHDIDFSGWWFLIQLIPYLGGCVILVFTLIDGTAGNNRFGADPKNRRQDKAQPQIEKNRD